MPTAHRIPIPVKRLTCSRCTIEINPLLARYLWLSSGFRGARKNRDKPRTTQEWILCGPCGRQVHEELQRLGIIAQLD